LPELPPRPLAFQRLAAHTGRASDPL